MNDWMSLIGVLRRKNNEHLGVIGGKAHAMRPQPSAWILKIKNKNRGSFLKMENMEKQKGWEVLIAVRYFWEQRMDGGLASGSAANVATVNDIR